MKEMKRKTHLSILFPILLLIHTIGFSNAQAFVVLKCARSTPIERFRNADAVFTGEVIRVTNYRKFSKVKLKVLKPLKNVHAENMTVFTARVDPESAHLELGESYLVYAHMQNGKLFTGGGFYTIKIKNV